VLNGGDEYYEVIYLQDEIFFAIGNTLLVLFTSSRISLSHVIFFFQDVDLQEVVLNAIQEISVFGVRLEMILEHVCQRKDQEHVVES